MIYSLKCGNCTNDNYVQADEPAVVWTCLRCGNESYTSLPTLNDRVTLITDHTKASSILSPSEASAAHDVMIGENIENPQIVDLSFDGGAL